MQEFRLCSVMNKEYHYLKFDKSKSGWSATDGSRRHPISKEGKRVNSALMNGLRLYVGNKLCGISHPTHPHNKIYQDNVAKIREENSDYKGTWLRSDLTRKVYIRCYNELNMVLPEYKNPKGKHNGRKSGLSELCMDYLKIDELNREVQVHPYYVDGLKDGIVYEFYGDFFHANPDVFKPTDKIFRITASEKWKKDAKRIEYIKSKGYEVKIIWEKDFKDFQSNMITENQFLEKSKLI